ncbi:MAG: hypothetical protein R3B49_01360 [Phycisphaerales bacterium]
MLARWTLVSLAAGGVLPATALASNPEARTPIGREVFRGQSRFAGHMYIKPATGEVVFTPADEYLANRARAVRSLGDDITGDNVPDYWVSTNNDPCNFGTLARSHIAILDAPTTQGDYHLYKSQISTSDVRVGSFSFWFWTDVVDTDTNSDTIPDGNTAGHGLELTFWDREDDFLGCSPCTISGGPGIQRRVAGRYELTNLPGPLTAPPANYLNGFLLTFDLSGAGNEFEWADTDGVGPASGNFNPMIAVDADSDTYSDADTNHDGLYDVSVSLHGIQPTDGRTATIGYQLAAPGVLGPKQTWDGASTAWDGDYIINLFDRQDTGGAATWDYTRVQVESVVEPMATPRFISTADIDANPNTANRSYVGRFSFFAASNGENPDPFAPGVCTGVPNSDFFGWGYTNSIDGTFYGGLNCTYDTPFALPWLALGGDINASICPCDIDASGVLNLDDVNLFAAGFIASDLAVDQDGNGVLNLDDINLFAACFVAGCS